MGFELKDTVKSMLSEDFRQRFVAEYWQTKIRYEKLKHFCDRIEASHIHDDYGITCNVNEPQHDCPLSMLREQQTFMGQYLHILELRAVIEHIDLNDEDCLEVPEMGVSQG